MPEETVDREPGDEAAAGGDAPPLRPVALRRADRWVLGEARRPEPGQPFEVRLADGSRQTFARPPITMAWVQPGTLLHEAAQDPDGVQRRFRAEPGQVVAQLLRDLGRPQVKADLVQRVADLHLRAPGDWWPAVSRALKAHPNVRVEGGRYSWSDSPVHAAETARGTARSPATRPAASPVRPAASPVRPAASPVRPAASPVRPAASPVRPGSTGPVSPVRPVPLGDGGPGPTRAPAESSRQTQARLTVLRTLRQLAQGAGDEEGLLRELEGAAADLPAGSAESDLAEVLVAAVLDAAALDTTPLPVRGLESSTRYDLARLAVRLRAHHAAVQALLALERLDTERLLAQVPWEEPGFAGALGEHVAGLAALDGRTAQRVEGVLRQVALALAGTGGEPGVRSSALVLLAALAPTAAAAPPGVLLLGRAVLRECLRPGLDATAVRDLPAAALVGLWAGPLRPDDLAPRAAAVLVLALDAADRADVLADPGFWAPLDVPGLAAEAGATDVLLRRGLVEPLVVPDLRRRLDGGDPREAARVVALPDELLAALPAAALEPALRLAEQRARGLRPGGTAARAD